MSVSNQTDKIYGSGNGVTTAFSFPFKIFDSTQLVVYLINSTTSVATGPLILNTDYTVSISSVTEGGTVTFIVAPATGYQWFVKRVVPYTQSAVIPTEGPLPGLQISNQLDLITMMVIQDQEGISRALLAPVTFTGTLGSLPTPVDGNAIGWSGTAGSLQNLPINAAAINVAVTAAGASASAAASSQTSAASSATTATTQATAAAASAAAAAASAAVFVATKFKVGSTTYDTATASGNKIITGVGFTPKLVFLIAQVVATTLISQGFSNGTVHECAFFRIDTSVWGTSTAAILELLTDGSNLVTATVSALGADGFTLAMVKTGSPTGTATLLYCVIG